MPRPLWLDSATDFDPKVTPRSAEVQTIFVNSRTNLREVESRMEDALTLGEEAIVLAQIDGGRMMVCRAIPKRERVLLITKETRGTGMRPSVQKAISDAAQLVAAEFNRHD